MVKTLYYTLVLSGMSMEDAYKECVTQHVYAKEELQEVFQLMKSRKMNLPS